jgi:hypothetical protein
MPCYEPPPPWEGTQRKNAEQAVRILCALVREDLASMPLDVVAWFLEHREVDLQIATTPYYGNLSPRDADEAKADIARARAVLEAAT